MRCKSDRSGILYGPRRETASNPFKEFMMKSSVFSKDVVTHKEDWNDNLGTTASACFGPKTVKLDRETAKLSTEIQRTSNFKFGQDENYPLITTKISEFRKHVLPPVKRVVLDLYSTNIPDFSRSCSKGKLFTDVGSVYVTSYQTPRTCSKSLQKGRQNLRNQTEDMRSTHFDFGSQKQRKSSETAHSYNERNYADPNEHSELRVVSPSSVFRKGDWNMRSQGMTYTSSVSHDHFSNTNSKETRNDRTKIGEDGGLQSEDDAKLKSSTNFQLARDNYLMSSLYKKDFRQSEFATPQYPLKTMREVRPKSAKVLNPISDKMCPISTEQSDFVYRHKEADDFLKKRSLEYIRNQEKDQISSVVLDEEGNDRTKYIKPISMSKKDYQSPPIELLRQHKIYRRPQQEYECIITDKCPSDKSQKTTGTRKIITQSNVDMEGQVPDEKKEKGSRDDHQTHFTFGSDIQRYPNSEQHDQFVVKTPMDPSYPSAGKSSKGVARIARDNVSAPSFPQLSVMKADYQSTSKLSSSQRRLVNLSVKYPTVIAPSHYFPKDHEQGKRISTTATDYAPPELMTV